MLVCVSAVLVDRVAKTWLAAAHALGPTCRQNRLEDFSAGDKTKENKSGGVRDLAGIVPWALRSPSFENGPFLSDE
jgi:hypothetical protein